MTDKDREVARPQDALIKGVRRLQDALIEDIMAATDEEILAEVASDGLDVDREAERLKAVFARAAGKAKMTLAKAGVEHTRARVPQGASPSRVAANDVTGARRLTQAARNGAGQSERDILSAAEDMAELEAFLDEKGRPRR
jgi:hypothetical protein